MEELQAAILEAFRNVGERLTNLEVEANYLLNPTVRVRRDATQPIPSAAYTPVEFDTEDYNPNDIWNAGSPTVFTIAEEGVYAVAGGCNWQALPAGTWIDAGIWRVLPSVYILARQSGNVQLLPVGMNLNSSCQMFFQVGDTIEFQIYQDSGGPINIEFAHFELTKIGDIE